MDGGEENGGEDEDGADYQIQDWINWFKRLDQSPVAVTRDGHIVIRPDGTSSCYDHDRERHSYESGGSADQLGLSEGYGFEVAQDGVGW